jgi:hypothetical protein
MMREVLLEIQHVAGEGDYRHHDWQRGHISCLIKPESAVHLRQGVKPYAHTARVG